MSLYDFELRRPTGEAVRLQTYAGKVLLIVNVASQCGFTKQYAGLQSLHQRYAAQGLVILAVPSNQFGDQEPGTDAEIASFCESNFGVEFDLFEKTDVRGAQGHPLFAFLTEKAPFQGFPAENPKSEMMTKHVAKLGLLEGNEIKWNFTKFLVSRDGRTIRRFESMQDPEELIPVIEDMLAPSPAS